MKLGHRVLGPATCTLSESPVIEGIIELSALHVPEYHRGKGAANKLIDAICEEADQSRKVLMLMPDSEWLADWYKTHGFEVVQLEPTLMARPPHKPVFTGLMEN